MRAKIKTLIEIVQLLVIAVFLVILGLVGAIKS